MFVKLPEMLYLMPREELVFESSPNQTVWKQLLIMNPNKKRSVAFKLKNTLPPLFGVRPFMGFLAPNESATVDIYMQPYIPDPDKKIPKFLIQAAFVTDREMIQVNEFWKMQRTDEIWSAKIGVKIVPYKYPHHHNGGGDSNVLGYSHEEQITFEAVSTMMKQVLVLKEEVHTLREQSKVFVNMAICVATVVAVIWGASLFW